MAYKSWDFPPEFTYHVAQEDCGYTVYRETETGDFLLAGRVRRDLSLSGIMYAQS
jgi:hypothetical protein